MVTGSYSIKIEGLDELIRDAKRAGGEFPEKLLGVMIKATTKVQEDAKRIGPNSFKNQTGNLRRNIWRRVEGAEKGIIGVGEKYGAYVEFGTRPHEIRPKKGKFLAFKSKSGKFVFAKVIHHPGTRAYPFMEPAFRDNVKPITDMYDQVAKELVESLGGV